MRRSWMGIAAVLGLLTGHLDDRGRRASELENGKGVFVGLKVGLPVTLKDVGAAYEVRVLDNARAARCRSQGREG